MLTSHSLTIPVAIRIIICILRLIFAFVTTINFYKNYALTAMPGYFLCANLNVTPPEIFHFINNTENLREIVLKVAFDNELERLQHENILREHFEYQIVDTGDNYFICKIYVKDPLQYYPELWKF